MMLIVSNEVNCVLKILNLTTVLYPKIPFQKDCNKDYLIFKKMHTETHPVETRLLSANPSYFSKQVSSETNKTEADRKYCFSHNTYMNYLTCPQSPVTQRGGGHRPKLQRMRTGGLLSSWHCAAGKVFKRSLLLHRTIRCLNPGPHFGVH